MNIAEQPHPENPQQTEFIVVLRSEISNTNSSPRIRDITGSSFGGDSATISRSCNHFVVDFRHNLTVVFVVERSKQRPWALTDYRCNNTLLQNHEASVVKRNSI